MPTDMRATRVPTGTPAPTATPLPTVTPLPTATSPPTETPLPAVPYRIAPYSVPGWTGVPRLYLVETVPRQEPVEQLRLAATPERMVPAMGFMVQKGIRFPMLHLGADYLIFEADEPLLTPHPDSILVGTAYLTYGSYLAVALDLSGETQFYLVTLQGESGPQPVLIAYTHLRDGSGMAALQAAQANDGRLEEAGLITPLGPGNPNPSDLHIAVINVRTLLARTGQNDLPAALRVLFSGAVERTGSQYPDLFLPPESIITPLAGLHEFHAETGTTPP